MEETRPVKDLDTYRKISVLKKIRFFAYIICGIALVFIIVLDVVRVHSLINILTSSTDENRSDLVLEKLQTMEKQIDRIMIADILPRFRSDIHIVKSIIEHTKEYILGYNFSDEKFTSFIKTDDIQTSFFKSPVEQFVKNLSGSINTNAAKFKGEEIYVSIKNSLQTLGVATVSGEEYDFFGGKLQKFSVYKKYNDSVKLESTSDQIPFVINEEEKKMMARYYKNNDDLKNDKWIARPPYVFETLRAKYGIDTLIKIDNFSTDVLCGLISTTEQGSCSGFSYDKLFYAIQNGNMYVYTTNMTLRDVFLKNNLPVYPFGQKTKDVFSIHHDCMESECKKNLSLSYERRMTYENVSLKNTLWIDYKNTSSNDVTMLEKIYVHPDAIAEVFGIQQENKKVLPLDMYDFYNEYGAKTIVFPIKIPAQSKSTFVFTYNTPNTPPEFVSYPEEFNNSPFYIEFKTARRIDNTPIHGVCTDSQSTYVLSETLRAPVEETFVLK